MKIHYKTDDKQAPAYLAKIKHEPVEYTGAWNPDVQELDLIRKINKETVNIPIRYIF